MSKHAVPKHAVTAPKGRATRARHDLAPPRRTFGSGLQWAFAIGFVAVVLLAIMIAAT